MRLLALLLLVPTLAAAAGDPRFCGPPARDASGQIIRSSAVLRDFKKLHPCPLDVLGLRPEPLPSCPGWILDHPLPLACGGCDVVGNLQWLPEAMWRAKSLWERKVYGGNGISAGCP